MTYTVYKVYNDIDSMVYYGSTTLDVQLRLCLHKQAVMLSNKTSNLYTHYRSIGANNMRIIPIIEIESKAHMYIIENTLIEMVCKSGLLNQRKAHVENKYYNGSRYICEVCGRSTTISNRRIHEQGKKHLTCINPT